MKGSREVLRTVAEKVSDVAVTTVGDAAGATVAPGTAARKLRSKATSLTALALVVAAALAYLLGRRMCREG